MKLVGKPIPVASIKEHKTKMFAVVDDNTGVVEYFRPIKQNRIGGSWVAMFQKSLIWLSMQGLTGEQSSVLMYLLGVTDYNNYIRIGQKDVAEKLSLTRQQVTRAIKRLKELEIIIEGPRAGLNKTYMLNPNMGIKGKQKGQKVVDFQAELAKRRKK